MEKATYDKIEKKIEDGIKLTDIKRTIDPMTFEPYIATTFELKFLLEQAQDLKASYGDDHVDVMAVIIGRKIINDMEKRLATL
jgi:hypothetical protein